MVQRQVTVTAQKLTGSTSCPRQSGKPVRVSESACLSQPAPAFVLIPFRNPRVLMNLNNEFEYNEGIVTMNLNMLRDRLVSCKNWL